MGMDDSEFFWHTEAEGPSFLFTRKLYYFPNFLAHRVSQVKAKATLLPF
jgi:hypothetical protein